MVYSLKHDESLRIDEYYCQQFACARIHLGIFNPEIQPIFNQDKSLCIFLDGIIYGYQEKLNELKNKRYKFNNENDLEFCLHSYEEYGKDFIKTLNGSFVLLIYDFKNRKVIIANDRFGLRIHYYSINNGKLIFAPEAKAILHDETFKKELNDEAIADLFSFGEFWGDKTLFKGISVLPPASILTYDGSVLSIEKYWEPKFKPNYDKSEDELVDELVNTFKNAIKIRMEDNFSYGVSLSGGLDSRSILGGMSPEKRKKVITFTFGPDSCDEIKIAEQVARRAGIKEHLTFDISPEQILNYAEQEVWLTDGRNNLGVSFHLPIYKKVKEKIDVVFLGFLMDHTITSSILTRNILNVKSEKELYKLIRNKVFRNSEEELNKLFTDEYYARIKSFPLSSFNKAFDNIKENNPGNKSNIFRIQNHVAWTTIGFVLNRTGTEECCPGCDNDFVDLCLTIPPELRLDRYIYRKFLMKLSSELAEIPYHKTMVRADAPFLLWKIGKEYLLFKELVKTIFHRISGGRIFFPNNRSYVNFNDWFHTNKKWQEYFMNLLLKDHGNTEKFFKKDYIEKLLQEQLEGKKNNSTKLLHIASFKIFLKSFFIKDIS